jgi:hypothetical protein
MCSIHRQPRCTSARCQPAGATISARSTRNRLRWPQRSHSKQSQQTAASGSSRSPHTEQRALLDPPGLTPLLHARKFRCQRRRTGTSLGRADGGPPDAGLFYEALRSPTRDARRCPGGYAASGRRVRSSGDTVGFASVGDVDVDLRGADVDVAGERSDHTSSATPRSACIVQNVCLARARYGDPRAPPPSRRCLATMSPTARADRFRHRSRTTAAVQRGHATS